MLDTLQFDGCAVDDENSPHLDKNGTQRQCPADGYCPSSHVQAIERTVAK